MVEVVRETAQKTATENPSMITGIFHNLPMIIFVLLVIGLIIAIIVIVRKKAEDDKRRDYPIYDKYCYDMETCGIKADPSWMDCKWSPINLLWLGIPFIWKEHSAKIRDKDEKVIGWYRGHSVTQDGYMNFLIYSSRKWLIFENKYLIKCPYTIEYLEKVVDNKTKEPIFLEDGKTFKTKKMKLDFRQYIKFKHNYNNDILIYCFNLEADNYYMYPVYVSENHEPIDLRQLNNENVVELGQGIMLAKVFEDGARMAKKGMEHNAQANYEQAKPQKTAKEKQDE
jgi:hypothetical protein